MNLKGNVRSWFSQEKSNIPTSDFSTLNQSTRCYVPDN